MGSTGRTKKTGRNPEAKPDVAWRSKKKDSGKGRRR